MTGLVSSFFEYLKFIDDFFWGYIGFSLLLLSGIFLTFYSKGFQFRVLGNICHCIREVRNNRKMSSRGINPIKLYFTSVSGMVGLGNIVGIITAIMIGGPGALFWLWIAAFPSMMVKYSEMYLGIRYRVANDTGGYDGGPMFYLKKAFKNNTVPTISCILLCIYGVEVFQFDVVSDTIVNILGMNHYVVITLLLFAILYSVLGGIRRLSSICSFLMPIFIVVYIGMCIWVIACYWEMLPNVLKMVFHSAFNGHAAVGGFAGSSVTLAAQQGISKAVYSGDIGIGYDSIIQAETQAVLPEQQARLGIFSLLTDTIICSLSILVVLVTDLWAVPMEPSLYVASALAKFFPHSEIFMAIFVFIAGFTTIIAFLSVGVKSATYLNKKHGKIIYLVLAVFSFIFFSFFEQKKALLMMSVSAGLLILLNISGILRLRKFIRFR
ncbi:MAG: amino acid carrier protein [Holosporales bacterium]|jgi:AGCS family alanine or glycine:cation symporter|nr:amino acid carrier protein [Holosporales bacterium]